MPQRFISCGREQSFLMPPDVRDWLPPGQRPAHTRARSPAPTASRSSRRRATTRPSSTAHTPGDCARPRDKRRRTRPGRSSQPHPRRTTPDARGACHARSRDDRPVRRASRAGAGGLVRRRSRALRPGGACKGRDRCDRRDEDGREYQPRPYEQISREILEDAKAIDAAEDERFGAARGDELPPELQSSQGRKKWLRAWQHQLDDQRAAEARPIPRDRPERLKEAKRRLEEELFTECRANEAYEAFRARG